MRTDELDYALPEALIAQHPADRRDAARLLVVDRASETIKEDSFVNLAAHLNPGDCLVLNDTRVIRARLFGRKPSGGQVEIFLLREIAPGAWEALVRPSAKVKSGTRVSIASEVACTVAEVMAGGRRRVEFDTPEVLPILERAGVIPLPPYIQRSRQDTSDLTRYQTIFAREPGAVAAPTAGLHYTEQTFASIKAAGIRRTTITLHVGYGTFKPIQSETIEDHIVDPEDYWISDETASLLKSTRSSGGKVVAAGTTTVRVLETVYHDGEYEAGHGSTPLYIYPPYQFGAVDALQTNFHLPRSSLLALVYAFGGPDLIRRAYAYAIQERFRFYSYGDTMLIL